MRLDVFLCERELAKSRTEAKNLIEKGAVSVFGKQIIKPSYNVNIDDEISVLRIGSQYVSRGGYKLEAALDKFGIDPKDRLAIDIGASSGGFTDCLLQRGANHVIAVDSGTMQLANSLRCDPRVSVMENTNARYLTPASLEYKPDLAVMDVSFISATYLMMPLFSCLNEKADFVCLIKPQFEVGKSNLGKGGIVKSEKAREMAANKVLAFAEEVGFSVKGLIESPITGGDGNIEYLAYFRKGECL